MMAVTVPAGRGEAYCSGSAGTFGDFDLDRERESCIHTISDQRRTSLNLRDKISFEILGSWVVCRCPKPESAVGGRAIPGGAVLRSHSRGRRREGDNDEHCEANWAPVAVEAGHS